jgi:hypothetical protein
VMAQYDIGSGPGYQSIPNIRTLFLLVHDG